MKLNLRFNPHDIWVGVYWNKTFAWRPGEYNEAVPHDILHVYICVIPCLPLHLEL